MFKDRSIKLLEKECQKLEKERNHWKDKYESVERYKNEYETLLKDCKDINKRLKDKEKIIDKIIADFEKEIQKIN